MKDERKQANGNCGSPLVFGRIEKGFNSLAENAEQIAFEQLLDQLNAEFAAAKPIHDLDDLSDMQVTTLYEEQQWDRLLQRLESARNYIKDVTRASRAGSAVNQTGLKLLKLLDQIEKGCSDAMTEFRTVSFTFVQLCRAECKKPADTKQDAKRIVAAILISLIMILLFELVVYCGPVTWFRNHPHSPGIQGSIICLIPSLIFGFFKPDWRKWCWGTAAIAFLVGLLSLL
jgi:hypothetical protein